MPPTRRTRQRDRRARRWCGALAACVAAALALAPAAGAAPLGHYAQRNLVSDIPGAAQITDRHLVNAWGLAFGPTTPAWVSDNGTDVSTLYTGGVNGSPASIVPLVVGIPGGAPTGAVFNPTTAFPVGDGPALFLFSSEAGRITGWNPNVPPPPPSTQAQTVAIVPDAVFKGLAIADTPKGPRLYATDFHHGTVDVWNGSFGRVTRAGAFRDPALPAGYAPFGIQAINGEIFVTYAKQDADAEDDVAGPGHGFVDVYDTNGTFLRRFASRGPLNSPWGLALAPSEGFGAASGALLVGNFGDGHINAFDPASGHFLGALGNASGEPITIDGLWALRFGNGVIGTPQSLLFTAGPDDEAHGLFGELTAAGG